MWFKNIQTQGKTVAAALSAFEQRHRQQASLQQQKAGQAISDVEQDIFTSRNKLKYSELEVIASNQDLAAIANLTQSVSLVLAGGAITTNNLVELSDDVPPSITQSQLNDKFDGEFNQPNNDMQPTAICGPNAGINEKNCPPDEYWVPSPKLSPGASNSVSSTIINYTYGYQDDATQLAGITNYKKWSTGSFYSRFKWSTHPTNTAAFKDSSLPKCDPDLTVKFSAPCDSSQHDVIYVPQSTYEDEGQIPNPACTLSNRSGTSFDRRYGCFVADYAYSNLPYAYLDTTVIDGQTFNAAVGSFDAARVIPGRTYTHYQSFWAWGNNDLSRPPHDVLNHAGQIGTRYCTWSRTFCAYSVDTTRVHKNLKYVIVPF